MTILFAGTPENAATTLRELVKSGAPISLVMTRPDSPVGRKSIVTPSPVAQVADELGIECIKTLQIDAEIISRLQTKNIEFAVVVAFGVILRTPALNALPSGWFNLHYSLLPKWRGAAPVQHALIAGDSETGVTVFRIDEGLDTGPIIAELPTQILANETAGDLLERLTHLGISLLQEIVPRISAQMISPRPQGTEGVTFAPKLSRVDAVLDFSKTSSEIESRYRGVTPEPGAWFATASGPVKVLAGRACNTEIPHGEIQLNNERVLLGAAVGSFELLEVQPAGKKPMAAMDWFRGLREFKVTSPNE